MKNSKKRFLTLALAVSMITATFSGLTFNSAAATVKPQAAKTTLNFWTISLQPTFTTFFNTMLDNYGKKNNVNVVWTDLPYDSIQQKLITAVAGGDAPDVVNLNTEMTLELAGKNAVVNLNKEATKKQRSIYISSLYNSAKVGSAVYAFPWYASPSVMVYNKALFKKAKITKMPKTFDAALKVAKQFKKKTGAYLYSPDTFIQMLFEDNISLLNTSKTKAAFNNPKTLAFLSKYKTAVAQNYIQKNNWGKWDDQLKSFETSKLGIINSPGSSISRIKDEAPDVYKNIGIDQPMTGKGGFVYDPLMNVVVPTGSKNHKAAIALASYITNDANQLAFCKKVAIFPSTKKAAADRYFTSDKKSLAGIARYYSAKSLSNSKDFSLGVKGQGDVETAINQIYEAVIMGNTSAKSALSTAVSKVNSTLAGN